MNQAIANIIKDHIEGLDFVDKISGLTAVTYFEIKDKEGNMVQKSFPVACCVTDDDCKEGAYNDLMPDSKYKTVIYFEDRGVKFLRKESHWKYYQSDVRLVCWINVSKILGDDCNTGTACTLAAHLIAEIIRILPEFPQHHSPFNYVYSEIVSQDVRSNTIFSAYTYDEKHSQYLMYPYDYFALDIQTLFAICIDGSGVYDADCGHTIVDLDTPVATAGTTVTKSGFTANWNAVNGATGYLIDIATDAAFTSFVADENAGNSLTIVVTGITIGTTYYYRVRAYSDTDTSDYSNTISIKMEAVDINGNEYHWVTIGTQQWMVENLKTTKYRDGSAIPVITDNGLWAADTAGSMCYYNNDEATYKSTYGALYNWHAVDNINLLAPTGWRVPSDADWTTLTTFLGGDTVAGGKLKEMGLSHWNTPNTGATDDYGFKGLPGGYRDVTGAFGAVGNYAYHWSSLADTVANAWYKLLASISKVTYRISGDKKLGLTVRCMRDIP
jgi:uncharacterized protein (TIGR02145 family)